MSRFLQIVFLVLFVSPLAFAATTAPSDASIKELMQLVQSRRLMEGTMHQMETSIRAMTQRQLSNEKLTPKQKKIIEGMQKKMFALIEGEMKWDSFAPKIAAIYKKTFSQHEVNGMIAFYKSKVGQAVIAKMPLVMRESINSVQGKMADLVPKLQKLQRETDQQLQQAASK